MAHHEPSKLSYQLLRDITNDFDTELGSGGFGTVYKAMHETHGEIAVKVLHGILAFDDKAFHKEFDNLRGLNHPNIVKLVGFCNESELEFVMLKGKQVTAERLRLALCLEFVQNGSLSKLISDEKTGLTWGTRYKIIKGICEGLKYLREGLKYPIMHFDLKPDNILLDERMVPKIADFGLSKLFGEENTRRTLSLAGTIGYCPPEYVTHQIISSQFDIFSLGVIIVRIMTGHEGYTRVVEMPALEFVELVHESWRTMLSGTLSSASLEVYCNQVKECIEIALDCLVQKPKQRPTIQNILSRLNGTEVMIGDHAIQNEQFYQEDPGESVTPSQSSITSGPSSGHAEASRSTQSNNYLSATKPLRITFSHLRDITDGFSEKRVLGVGPYGRVYKGVLDNGELIAVKKLHSQPGLDENMFRNEIPNLMGLQHENVIRLVSYCYETRDRVVQLEGKLVVAGELEIVLCSEYMQGGTLEELLSDELLDWESCYKIIKGICQGLKHLHTGSKIPVYHLDLKPTNILLDKDMIPKIGDFGISRLLDAVPTFVSKTNQGTRGYKPPEYNEGPLISSKFDVFSLGIIIVRIIAGPEGYYNYKGLYSSPQEFIDHVTGKLCMRVQAKTMSAVALLEAQKCIKIALRCVEDDRAKRPTITEIVDELNMIDLLLAPLRA